MTDNPANNYSSKKPNLTEEYRKEYERIFYKSKDNSEGLEKVSSTPGRTTYRIKDK